MGALSQEVATICVGSYFSKSLKESQKTLFDATISVANHKQSGGLERNSTVPAFSPYLLAMYLLTLPLAGPVARPCEVIAGKAHICQATGYTGIGIVHANQRYRTCQFVVGKAHVCAHPYTGDLPLYRQGRFHLCKIRAGILISCQSTGYTGWALSPAQSPEK
jgi:hypothetical protein